jgi:hypothetical protein
MNCCRRREGFGNVRRPRRVVRRRERFSPPSICDDCTEHEKANCIGICAQCGTDCFGNVRRPRKFRRREGYGNVHRPRRVVRRRRERFGDCGFFSTASGQTICGGTPSTSCNNACANPTCATSDDKCECACAGTQHS